MKHFLASILVMAGVAPAAFADRNIELSGGYSNFDAATSDLGALTARGTYFFNKYLGAEGEVSFGVNDTNVGAAKVELDNSFAAFGVARAPVTEQVELFGRLGLATTSFSASGPVPANASADVSGLAYGVGGKFFFDQRFGVRADISRFEGNRSNADVLSISGILRF